MLDLFIKIIDFFLTSISSKIILQTANSFINFLAECFSFFSNLSFSLDSFKILVFTADVFISSNDVSQATTELATGEISVTITSGVFCGILTGSGLFV